MHPAGWWFFHEGHDTLDCHCIPVIDIENRILSHFSTTMIGMASYGPHMRARMEDLRTPRKKASR